MKNVFSVSLPSKHTTHCLSFPGGLNHLQTPTECPGATSKTNPEFVGYFENTYLQVVNIVLGGACGKSWSLYWSQTVKENMSEKVKICSTFTQPRNSFHKKGSVVSRMEFKMSDMTAGTTYMNPLLPRDQMTNDKLLLHTVRIPHPPHTKYQVLTYMYTIYKKCSISSKDQVIYIKVAVALVDGTWLAKDGRY
jgi:hypothetical protein